MKVLINGYGVDFSIENEKTLKEVTKSILTWAQERDLIFTDVYVDGEAFTIDTLPEKNIDDIEDINCLVQSKADLIISTMHEAVSYCDKILYHVSKAKESGTADKGQRESFVKGLEWMGDAAKVIFALLSIDEKNVKYLDRTLADYFTLLDSVKTECADVRDEKHFADILIKNKELFETVKAVFKMLFLSDNLKSIIVKGLESPNQLIEGLVTVKNEIPSQIEKLESAAVAFQSGRDAEGADHLQLFIDFIYRYIRLCHQVSPVFGIDPSEIVSGDLSLDRLNAMIYSYLEEIVSVMENGDIISLSDILEYQMKVEIEKCAPFIDLMLEKIS